MKTQLEKVNMSELQEQAELKDVVQELKNVDAQLAKHSTLIETSVSIDTLDESLTLTDIAVALEEVKSLNVLDENDLVHLFHLQDALRMKEIEAKQLQKQKEQEHQELIKKRKELVNTIEQYFSFDSKLKNDYMYYSVVKKHFEAAEENRIINAFIATSVPYTEDNKRIVFKVSTTKFADTKNALISFLMSKGHTGSILERISAHTQANLIDFESRKAPLKLF